MSNDVSVAPKERVNITYKAAIGDSKVEVELPFKMLMMGNYTGKEDDTPLEERKVIEIDKHNFNSVLKSQDLGLQFSVANKLSENEDELTIDINIEHIKDFEPQRVVEAVPELNKLLELRDALTALKGPLGNVPAFRRKLEEMTIDDNLRSRLLTEIQKNN